MQNNKFNKILNEIFGDLDIPDYLYEKAETSYKSFGEWLHREDSSVKQYMPVVFLQGSFKLGTVIKPISSEIHYDIDMICKFNELYKSTISQKDLKDLLGKEVKLYAKSHNMVNVPKDGKRCWTLNYNDEAQFHMDILPSIENYENFSFYHMDKDILNKEREILAITDKNSNDFSIISNNWEISNPKGYYEWFQEKSKFREKKRFFAESYKKSIEEIPDYKIKTPLQKVIQMLKRHRDKYFIDNSEKAPSSVIISTLSAHSYNGREQLDEILKDTINSMENFIVHKDGKYIIENPSNKAENFADKWSTDFSLAVFFFDWIDKLKEDFEFLLKDELLFSERAINVLKSNFNINNSNIVLDIPKELSQISYRKKPTWEIRNLHNIKVKALKKSKGFRYHPFASGELLPKNTDIKFEVLASNIDLSSCEIYWQVTNRGFEAENAKCLRGDFYSSEIVEGKKVRKEITAYKGVHLVEVYVVRNNVCIAQSLPFYVNIA